MINAEDVRAFMRGFYGYGSYEAKYWFIGQEEGGASSVSELTKRVEAWRGLGGHDIEDLYEFHAALGFKAWFDANAKRQPTWARLIQIVLTAEGRSCANEDIVRYQSTHLGRLGSETLLSELMPLPAKNLGTWYADELDIPELGSRRDYIAAVRPDRIRHLKRKISEHQPEVAIFYGARRCWPRLLNIEFKPGRVCDSGQLGTTQLLTMNHPTAFGARREDFDEVARSIARRA